MVSMTVPGNADAALAPVKIEKISGRKARPPNFRGREALSPLPVRPAAAFFVDGCRFPGLPFGLSLPRRRERSAYGRSRLPCFIMPGERMPSAAKMTGPGGSFRKRERIAVGLSAGTFGSAMLSARTPETVVGKCLRKTERSELDGFAVRRIAETVSPACPFCGRIAARRDSGAFERRVAECSEKDRNDIFSTDERSCRTNACGSGYVFGYIGPRSSLCRRRYAVRVMLPVRDGPAARIGRFGCGHRATTGAVRFRTSLTGPIV